MKRRFFLLLTFLFFILSNPVYAQNWRQINVDGFGDANNHGVGGFSVYKDHVYVGTLHEVSGGEVWRYDGTTWSQVNITGFGDEINSICSMAVYDNCLYVGTSGGEVWQYNGTEWTQVNTTGFGDANNEICSMGLYENCLYVGTCKENIGWCEVWKYDGSTWTQVNSDGFGDANNEEANGLVEYNGCLYAGVTNENTGCEVWQYNGTIWAQVNTDGFGDGSKQADARGMACYNGHLYVGTENKSSGCEIWKYDGSIWTQVNIDGFGDVNNEEAIGMAVYNNYLFVGTETADQTGAEVWRYDGSSWMQVNTDGFGDANNFIALDMGVYNDRLYVGTLNDDTGAEVWQFSDIAVNYSDYFPVDPEKYGIKRFQWTYGRTGQFTSRIEGTKTVPYVSGEISGVRVTNLPEYEWVWIIYNDGLNVKYLGYEASDEPGAPLDSYYLSTDCSLTDHPSVFSFNTLNDGMIIDQGIYYTVKSDFSDCEMDNDQMILISIQDVRVLKGNYENAVIMWWLDTKYPFKPLDFHGKESDLGITLPTSSDTNGYSITAFDISGSETGPIAGGDIAASTGSLIELNELRGRCFIETAFKGIKSKKH